jgi:hypothetical protein
MLNWVIATDEISSRDYKLKLKWQSTEWRHSQSPGKHKVQQTWQSFWCTTSKVFLCVIPFHSVILWMQSTTSHFPSTTYIMWCIKWCWWCLLHSPLLMINCWQQQALCESLGFHSSVVKDSVLLGYHSMSLGNWFQAMQHNIPEEWDPQTWGTMCYSQFVQVQ